MGAPLPEMGDAGFRYDVYAYRSPQRLVDPTTLLFVDLWQTTAPFTVVIPDGREITVPEGFVYDKASIPQLVQNWCRRDDKEVIIAALIHDYLYQAQKIGGEWISRDVADDIFYGLIRAGGMRYTKAKAAYSGVRAGGWRYYNKRARTKRNPLYS